MTFDEMIETDLAACNEFGGKFSHIFDRGTDELDYLCFDEKTDVILEKGEFGGVEATVPTLTIQTTVAAGINHRSSLNIKDIIYEVIEVHKLDDNTTVIYLGKYND